VEFIQSKELLCGECFSYPAERVSAACKQVRAGVRGVEHSVWLLEALGARGALDPAEVAACVGDCCEFLCRCAQGELHACDSEALLQLVDAALAPFHSVQESLAGRFRCCVGLETVPVDKVGPQHLT
jgi:hypothetical protein